MCIVNQNRTFCSIGHVLVFISLLTERRAIKYIMDSFFFVVQSHQKKLEFALHIYKLINFFSDDYYLWCFLLLLLFC